MKKDFKRLFALLLTLCMLASLMVPVAFAEDEAVESPAATVVETYPIRLKDLAVTDANAAVSGTPDYLMTVKNPVLNEDGTPATDDTGAQLYDGRKYDAVRPHTVRANITKLFNSGDLNWDYINTSGYAALFYYPENAFQLRQTTAGTWNALRIRVPESGRFSLNMTLDLTESYENWDNSATLAGWAKEISAYIIPYAAYEAAGADTAAINSLMTEKYFVGTDVVTADAPVWEFNKVAMERGNYVVVYTSSEANATISEMSLVESAEDAAQYALETVATYPIRVVDMSQSAHDSYTGYNSWFKSGSAVYKSLELTTQSTNLETYYDDLNWKLIDVGNKTQWDKNYMMQLCSVYANQYVALQIKVPQSGAFCLTISTDRTYDDETETTAWRSVASDGTDNSKWSGDITAYIVPVAELNEAIAASDAATAIPTFMTDAYSVSTATLAAEDTKVEFNRKYMEAGEYAVIYKASVANLPVCEMALEQRVCDKAPEKADVQVSETYNIGLYNEPDFGIADGKTLATEITLANGETTTLVDHMNASYADGSLNWKLENYADKFTDAAFSFISNNNNGMKVYTPADSDGDWFAYRIRVPQGGYYSISFLGTRGSSKHYAYMFPAASDAMSADEIAQQMTPANGLHYGIDKEVINTGKISAGYLQGEYIIAIKAPHADTPRTLYLTAITLETEAPINAENVQSYSFDLFDETNPYYSLVTERYTATTNENNETVYELMDLLATGNTGSKFGTMSGVVTSRDENGNPAAVNLLYAAVYKADGSGYPKTLNWRPDAAYAGEATDSIGTDMKLHFFYNAGTIPYKIDFTSDVDNFGAFLLHIDKAGTYDLSVTAGAYKSSNKIYFVDTMSTNYATKFTDDEIRSLIADETYLVGEGSTALTANTTVEVGRVTVDAAGDFLIIFDADAKTDISLKNITLTPVIEEAAAGVAGKTYASLNAALAAAEPGDTVDLLDAVAAETISIPAGVTLNLNGQSIKAESVEVAAAAQVIDSTDGTSALIVNSDVTFETNNAQLPLRDADTGAYYLYNVDIEPVTITGKNGDSPKYWFQVKFSNKNATALIGEFTEMRIQANLSWEDQGDAVYVATADAAFSAAWASKYTVNDGIYITVTAVDAGEITDFALAPQVTANGVVISGDAMHKGA